MKIRFVYATLSRSVRCSACSGSLEHDGRSQTYSVKVGAKDWAVFAESSPPEDVALVADCHACSTPVRLQTPMDAVLTTDHCEPRFANLPSIQMYRHAAATRW